MIMLMLLAIVSRCALPTLCPSDADLVAAIRARDAAVAAALSDQAAAKGEIVLTHTQRIRRISDVVCGDRLPGEAETIMCKFTIRYWSQDAYQVAKLVKRDEDWQVTEALGVNRDRR
ncbi:MAG: hypothetical protein JSS55_16650 [Proteobacteria bacterium]|nr:hypothetical protein [Pseudomonadota bacterium]